MVDKNKAVVCCLLATSAIMLSEKKKRKRKMWSRKWCLKSIISCDAHLLNELLETDVPWDDGIMVSAGKLRKLWDPEWTAHFFVWKTTGKDGSEAFAISCQKCTVYSVFPCGMTSHTKIAQFNCEGIGRFIMLSDLLVNIIISLDFFGVCEKVYYLLEKHFSKYYV